MKALTTRAEIVERLYNHVWQHGYSGTSIGDIADQAGILKGSFYNYFRNKSDFTNAVLEKYAGEWTAFMQKQLSAPGRAPDRFKRLFGALRKRYRDKGLLLKGCLAGNLCQETARHDSEFAARVESVFGSVEPIIRNALEEGRREGSVAAGVDTDKLAAFLLNSLQGANLRMKSARTTLSLDLIETHLNAFVFTKRPGKRTFAAG